MFLFWFIAFLFVVLALAFVLAPLMMRPGQSIDRDKLNVAVVKDKLAELDNDLKLGTISQKQHDLAVTELQSGLLQEVDDKAAQTQNGGLNAPSNWQVAVIVLIALPLLSVVLYHIEGTPVSEVLAKREGSAAVAGHDGMNPEQMINAIRDNIKNNPEEISNWIMLSRAYTYLQQPQNAEKAYKEGLEKTGDNPQLKADYANFLTQTNRAAEAIAILEKLSSTAPDADILSHYADALAMKQGGLSGKPYTVVKQALQMQPFNKKALWLAGTAAYQEQDFKSAVAYWENLMRVLEPNSQDAKTLSNSIAEAKQMLGGGAQTASAEQPAINTAAKAHPVATTPEVGGTVTLAADLQQQAKPEDTVWLFARAVSGPAMPLAVQRLQVKDLPYKFVLDESKAMNADLTLASAAQVVITARISKSGDVMQQPGDLFGKSAAVMVGDTKVAVEINQIAGQTPAAAAPVTPVMAANATPAAAGGGGKTISGKVTLSKAIAGKVAPEDTLFVYAKAVSGPRMPLAVIRKQVKDLPLEFTLDDSLSMSPAAKLSDFADVIVTALVSKSGTAMQQSGDVKGASDVIKLGTDKLEITIDSVIP